jgi:ribosomal-protein-alanine N-acetyltransferase
VVLVNISINRDGDVVLTEKSRLWAPPVIETKGLLLRALDLADAKSIFEYAKNPNVCRYTLWSAHKSIDDSVSFIRDYALPHYAQGTPEPFGIALREEPNIIIGTVGCFWTSKTAKAMELAYAIGEAHWGKGLVAEAAQNVMEYCFKEFSLKRIQSRCKAENVASARVMEKIGMVYEGTLKSAVFNQNRFWDMRYYAKVVD